MNLSIPWPVQQQYRQEPTGPDEWSRERVVRKSLLAATNAEGFDARRIMFVRSFLAPDLRNRVVRGAQ